MFPTALLMLALDQRDRSLIDATITAAGRLGIQRLVAVHAYLQAPFPEALAQVVERSSPPRPAALDIALTELRAALDPIDVVGVYVVGDAREEMAKLMAAESADIVLLGRHRREGSGDAWGTLGLKLVRVLACTTLVVPEGSRLDLSRVVAGMDFSGDAVTGLQIACNIGDNVDAVFQYDLRDVATGAMTEAEFHDHFTHNAVRHFHEVVLSQLDGGVQPALAVIEGHNATAVLVEVAAGALLVVGSRGLSPMAATLLGSVAERTAGRSDGPVLIVRKKGEQLGLLQALVHR